MRQAGDEKLATTLLAARRQACSRRSVFGTAASADVRTALPTTTVTIANRASKRSLGTELIGKTRLARCLLPGSLSPRSVAARRTPRRRTCSIDLTISLLARKIQGILPFSPVGSSQMVQNIGRITISYERIPRALEQGNFGSHQGIELGKSVIVWQGAIIGRWHLC
jgi:hypothetical protein